MRPDVVFFDFGGTLDADGVPWKDRFLALFRAEGVDVDPERFFRAYYDADDPIVERGDEQASYAATVRELAAALARALAPGREGLGTRVAEAFLEGSRVRIAENIRVLERLRRRGRVGIISNFYGNLASACRETGLDAVVDVAVDSERVGAGKPDPRIFRAALAEAGVEASQALMVGDSLPRDIEGAEGVGMPWLLLLRSGAEIPPHVPPERVIRTLAEIEERLA